MVVPDLKKNGVKTGEKNFVVSRGTREKREHSLASLNRTFGGGTGKKNDWKDIEAGWDGGINTALEKSKE